MSFKSGYEVDWLLMSMINHYRIKKHVSLKELSIMCGIDKANLSRILNCKIGCSVHTLIKILDALGLYFNVGFGRLYPSINL